MASTLASSASNTPTSPQSQLIKSSPTSASTPKSYYSTFQRSSFCSCNKFVPQAFNNNKCQQCFNLKESHSAEALAEFSKVFIST